MVSLSCVNRVWESYTGQTLATVPSGVTIIARRMIPIFHIYEILSGTNQKPKYFGVDQPYGRGTQRKRLLQKRL